MTSVAELAAQPVQARPALAPPPPPARRWRARPGCSLAGIGTGRELGRRERDIPELGRRERNKVHPVTAEPRGEGNMLLCGVGAGSTGLPTPDMGTKVHRIPCCSSDFWGFVPAGSPSLSTMRGKTSGGPHAMGSMCDWSSNYTPGAATAATSYRAATPICRWAFMRQPGTLHSGSRRDGPV